MIDRTAFIAVCLLVGTVACSESTPPTEAPPAIFPNASWTTPATDSPTGVRLRQAAVVLRNFLGEPVDWSRELHGLTGFSPLQPILLRTRNGCPALPAPGQEAWSVADTSPVWLLSAGRRIPWFGETGEDPMLCVLYPLDTLAAETTATVDVRPTFAAELSGALPDGPVSFPVGSFRERVTAAARVADAARLWAQQQDKLLLTIDWDPPDADVRHARLTARGTFRIPDYTAADGLVHWNADGSPTLQGEATEVFYAVVSTASTALTTPLPLVQYGHGLFGDPKELWSDDQSALRDAVGGLFGAIPWGMAVRYFHRAAAGILNPTNLPMLRDQVWQSLGNKTVFTRVLRSELGPLVAQRLGQPVSDVVDYIGISQGGILGGVLAAVNPQLRRVVLHVGGGGWTPMMTHSSNWFRDNGTGFGDIVRETWPDATQRTRLLALWQNLWDQWDPAIFSRYWFAPAIDEQPAPPSERRVYYPYAIADPQVPNFSSETVLRATGGVLLQPSVTQPWGIAGANFDDGPFPVAAVQWDVGPGEPAHSEPRKLGPFAQQVATFLRTGRLIDTCGGQPCIYPLP